MMFKIIGALFVIAGCAGVSYSLNRDIRKAAELKQDLIRMLRLLESEIRHRNLNLPECFLAAAARLTGSTAAFLEDLAEELKHRSGMPLAELWSDKALLHFGKGISGTGGRLKENEMTQLCRFGAGFGFGDQTTQLNMLRQYEQLLVEEAEQAALKQRDTTRIYNTMGVLSGILIVLMLL